MITSGFCVVGLSSSWMLIDGVFAQIATLDRTQPEGLALATYLGAVVSLINTFVVPLFARTQRWLRWPMKRWMLVIAYAQLAACCIGAAAWHTRVGGCSIVLYALVLVGCVAGNSQQLVLVPWLAGQCNAKRIPMAMAGGQLGVLVTACVAYLQSSVGILASPSLCFGFLGCLVASSALAIHRVEDVEGELQESLLQIEDAEPNKASCWAWSRVLRGGCEPWRPAVRAIAASNAYLQLIAWVFMRSTLPYTFAALRPRSAGNDGGSYLSVAVSGSYVMCFLGAMLATSDKAPAFNRVAINALTTVSYLLVGIAALAAKPPVHTPVWAVAAICASLVVRFLDGFCSPIWYRQIHELSGSTDLVRQAGALAILVATVGVWVTLVLVLVFDPPS